MKRLHKVAHAAFIALSFLAISTAHAADDWVNFATVSMTDPTTPKLTNGYGCRTDGKDILCDSAASAVNFGTGGLIDYGGMTVMGSISASAVSTTYVSATVLQINPSNMSCSTGLNGTIRYSATSNTLEVCAGTSWTTLSSNTTPGNIAGGGSATTIAFWSGPNSLTYESATTSGLYWDHANARLGVGTNLPTFGIEVSSSSGGIRSFINSSTLPAFEADTSAAGNLAYLRLRKAGNTRWDVGANGAAEGGSNAGSDLYVNRFADNGGFLGTPFLIERSTGNVGIGTTAPNVTLQVSGTFTVSNSTNPNSPSLFVPSNGSVGVFTTNPAPNALDVSGDIRVSNGGGSAEKAMFLRFNPLLNSGYIGTYDWSTATYLNTAIWAGSLGIGTGGAYPSSLTVANGEIQTASSGAPCVTATNGGAIRYNAGTLYYCNGSNTWSAISGGGAGFTGGGSATAIAFWNGTNSLTYESATTSGLYWDHTNGRLGIGTNSPGNTLYVSRSDANVYAPASAVSAAPNGMVMTLDNADMTNGTASLIQFVTRSGGLINRNYFGTVSQPGNAGIFVFGQRTGSASYGEMMRLDQNGYLGLGTQSPTATLQVSGSMIVSTTGQNTASAASMLVDTRGVSVSSILHITGSAFSPIGAGGNVILSGSTAVSTSSAGSITFYTGGSQVLGIDSVGRVGIGTVTPTQLLTVNGAIQSGLNGYNGQINFGGSTEYVGSNYAGHLVAIGTNGTERMRIDSGGHVMINTTAPNAWLTINNTTSYSGLSISGYGNGIGYGIYLRPANDTGPTPIVFLNAAGSVVGSVGTNSTNTAYNTSSDRRVKENITDSHEGLEQLMAVPVHEFSFRADPSHTIVNGFIAQELNKVYPDAVTTNGDNGEVPLKDKSKIWQVDYGRVTPLIVKAVQDLKHLFDSDKAETDAKLKAANDNIQTLGKQVEALREEVMRLKQGQQ